MEKPKKSPLISAAVLTRLNSPLEFVHDLTHEPLKEGQVLVKVKFAGLCHSQVMEAKGRRGADKFLPHLLGHEGVGTVVCCGPNVTKVCDGDEVVLGWIKGNGIDAGPSIYKSEAYGTINAGAVTTFSNYTVVSENRLYQKPENTPDHLAVLYGCALPTGVGLVFNELKPKEKSTIAVLGLGGIGLSALLACKQFRPKSLIAIDVNEEKLKMAKEMGADWTFNSQDHNLVEKLSALVGRGGLDYCIEAAGLVSTIELGFSLIRRQGGQLIFASHPKAGDTVSLDPFELICGKSIRGSWGGGSNPDADIEIMGSMYDRGTLPLEKLISHEYALDEINQAIDDLDNRRITRGLIRMTHAC